MTLTDQNNTATIEIKNNNGTVHRIPCSFEEVKGKRLSVQSPERVAAFTTLSIEYNDALFLGEVIASTQGCAGNWHVEIKVEQILTGLQSLVTLRSRLLGESVLAMDTRPAMAAR